MFAKRNDNNKLLLNTEKTLAHTTQRSSRNDSDISINREANIDNRSQDYCFKFYPRDFA